MGIDRNVASQVVLQWDRLIEAFLFAKKAAGVAHSTYVLYKAGLTFTRNSTLRRACHACLQSTALRSAFNASWSTCQRRTANLSRLSVTTGHCGLSSAG
jgi:hypothetical protein